MKLMMKAALLGGVAVVLGACQSVKTPLLVGEAADESTETFFIANTSAVNFDDLGEIRGPSRNPLGMLGRMWGVLSGRVKHKL